MLFLCSPGNPTAKALTLFDIERIAVDKRAQDTLVVVDEAYVDFSTKGSAVELVTRYPNICVLQTLSKAFGLAAIRCGFCIGPPDVIQLMNNVKAPYNVNQLTSSTALAALDAHAVLQQTVETVRAARDKLMAALADLPFVVKVFPSDANFILFRLAQNAQAVYKAMADGGVVTRYRGNELHCAECIRVTVGTPAENQAFLEQLVAVYNQLL